MYTRRGGCIAHGQRDFERVRMAEKKEVKAIFKAIRKGETAAVKALVDANADLVNCCASAPPKKDDGQSPLQVALKTGQLEIADFLVERRADVNFMEESQINAWRTPVLHDAIMASLITMCYGGDLESRADAGLAIVKKLLAKGADPLKLDSYGNNALHRAVMDAKIALNPIYGAATEAIRKEKVAATFTLLIGAGADPNAATPQRPPPLQVAAGSAVELFLKPR
jgi:ankyrin repeat protein